MSGETKCVRPPNTWECSREAGHEGPCAATVKTSFVSDVTVTFSEEETLALAAALDGNRSPGNLGSAIGKVSSAAMGIVYGSSSRVKRAAVSEQ